MEEKINQEIVVALPKELPQEEKDNLVAIIGNICGEIVVRESDKAFKKGFEVALEWQEEVNKQEQTSICRGCKQSIRWIKTKAGKNMPCEVGGFQGMTLGGEMVTVFQPHWSNCVKAKYFKR
jgi:hypothetical protein